MSDLESIVISCFGVIYFTLWLYETFTLIREEDSDDLF